MAALKVSRTDALSPAARCWLERLGRAELAASHYLAGSAALALYLGHRPVAELDFMGEATLDSPERRDLLRRLLELDPDVQVETARDGYLYARGSDGTGLRFYHYPYQTVLPPVTLAGCPVATPIDLGLMKSAAIISRGARHDFVDLYLLCQELPLEEVLAHASQKFPQVRDFPLQALKGLADRGLAEQDPMPRLLVPLEWEAVTRWADASVRDLGRRRIGLEA